MARATDAELEQLKTQVAVADLMASDGVALSRSGVDLAGLCPLPNGLMDCCSERRPVPFR
jgi:hypothetical protein